MIYDLLIVGGGISGLGLAHLSSRRGLRTMVLEANYKIGGCIATHTFANTGGFWVEAGAHTCYNSYGHLLQIIHEVGLNAAITPKLKLSFKLLQQGQVCSLLSGLHPLELSYCVPRLLWERKAGRSVKDYYTCVLGQRNYQDLFGPAFNAVICQPADDFPVELLFRPKPRRKDIPRSFTFPRGLASITDAIVRQTNLEVMTQTTVVAVEQEIDGFKTITADGKSFSSHKLAIATPPDQAASILAKTFPELAGLLGDIHMAEITSISVAMPTKFVAIPRLAGIIAAYEPFYSAVSRDYLHDTHNRGFTFHFPKDRLDPNRQIGRIREVLQIPKDQLATSIYTNHRLPAMRSNHVERVTIIDKFLAKTGLMLTGNYFLGVSMEDCLTRSYSEWQRLAPAICINKASTACVNKTNT